MSTPETRPAIGSWRLARGLLPIYIEVAPAELPPPCSLRDLENDGSDARVHEAVLWFDRVDAQLKPADFRRRLRLAAGSHHGDVLELVLERMLARTVASAAEVQKVDEACFDYYCLHAPPDFLT